MKQKGLSDRQDTVYQKLLFEKLRKAPFKSDIEVDSYSLPEGDTAKLINCLDLSFGSLKLLAQTVTYTDSKIGSRPEGYYYTENETLIKDLFSNLYVKIHHGDCCTPDGFIKIIRNDTCVFTVGILHKPGEGFQGGFYAYSEPLDSNVIEGLLRPLKRFDKINTNTSW
jgi:hypothetical protein